MKHIDVLLRQEVVSYMPILSYLAYDFSADMYISSALWFDWTKQVTLLPGSWKGLAYHS